MSISINKDTKIYIEECALSGVKKIGTYLASDLSKVFGQKNNFATRDEAFGRGNDTNVIIVATLGYSELLNDIDLSDIQGKREVYKFLEIDGSLYIIGSDKRGTIYGMFHLSELCGVSPLVDWFKCVPAKKDEVIIADDDMITSKEPSVRYRGFFINDEWPAFGNWCTHNYGGMNAKAYEQIFVLLLRMKGNYMWPAMWSAIFPNDGPGLLNCELADELGVVMGMSHHEPCLRQGEEYRYLRGKDSIYGDAWNFRTNRDGITRFWEDGLKRSGKFENVITVGMRGEADTAIMGKDATLKDNIDLLRDVLKTQNRLIRENVNENLDEVPRMLALYKEVEPYFYGDENTPGLMNDPELDGVTLMLCDDNFGNLRTVPTKEMQDHKGGYGMYYHFDYHGGPISFEWVNSSYLPKVWEQMTSAYEFGIRDLWIVNVGDLFTMEYPLSFFLDLAYDYEKWGISNLNSAALYTQELVERISDGRCADELKKDFAKILWDYSRISHKRRTEAMNSKVYDPLNYFESENLLKEIAELEILSDNVYDRLPAELRYPAFLLMYYPARANLNVQKLQLLTGKNNAYAALGRTEAMEIAKEVEKCLAYDVGLVDRLHNIDDMRWFGMGLSEHIGFNNWCEEGCQYPVLSYFKPANKERIIVSIPGTDAQSEGGPWTKRVLELPNFLIPENTEGYIDLSVAGVDAEYTISTESKALSFEEAVDGNAYMKSMGAKALIKENLPTESGRVKTGETKRIKVILDRSKIDGVETKINVDTVETKINVDTALGTVEIRVPICLDSVSDLRKEYGEGTYIWCGEKEVRPNSNLQYVSMEAAGFLEKTSVKISKKDMIAPKEDLDAVGIEMAASKECINASENEMAAENASIEASFEEIPYYGKTVSAVKAFPLNVIYDMDNAPSITYKLQTKREGTYVIDAYLNPSNYAFMDGRLYYGISINGGELQKVNALPEGYKVGDYQYNWAEGVLNNIRISSFKAALKEGVNTITYYALSPNFVLEKVVVYEDGKAPKPSYLGPSETPRI